MRNSVSVVVGMLLGVAAAQGVMAQDKTRADVKAEAADARKAGKSVGPEGDATGPVKKTMPTKSRAEVKSEAAAARKAGKTNLAEGDAGGPVKKAPMTKPRSEVKAEAKAARNVPKPDTTEGGVKP